MKIKTSELTGAALNWAVAKCVNPAYGRVRTHQDNKDQWHVTLHGERGNYAPSTIWAQGGEIIEREGINTSVNYQDDAFGEVMYRVGWKASYWNDSIPGTSGFLVWAYGDTALIAAMRCLVMSKLGKEIEIPQELL